MCKLVQLYSCNFKEKMYMQDENKKNCFPNQEGQMMPNSLHQDTFLSSKVRC